MHVSDPNLEPPSNEFRHHNLLSKLLKQYKYSKFISIEMRQIDDKDLFENIIKLTKNLYS